MSTTFEIGTDKHGKFILCHVCKRRSYSPGDIENRYCGFCHEFHDDRAAAVAVEKT
jgi:hypothetical protein